MKVAYQLLNLLLIEANPQATTPVQAIEALESTNRYELGENT